MRRTLLVFMLFWSLDSLAMAGSCRSSIAPSPQGLASEASGNAETLLLSFADLKEPLLSVRLQILKEFIAAARDPQLLLITDGDPNPTLNKVLKESKIKKTSVQFLGSQSALWFNSAWTRDFAPVVIKDKDGEWTSVHFKYQDGPEYNEQKDLVSKSLKISRIKNVDLFVEGGNLLTDEAGRLYVSSAIVDKNPIEGLSATKNKKRIEAILKEALNAQEVVWIPRFPKSIEGTGHVDMYLKFLSGKRVVVTDSSDPADDKILRDLALDLKSKGFQVYRLKAHSRENKFRPETHIFMSHTNAITVGNKILLASYGAGDKAAKALYERLGYEVVFISGDSIDFGGSVHCLTYLYQRKP